MAERKIMENPEGSPPGEFPVKETGKIKRFDDPVGAYLETFASDLADIKDAPVLDISYLSDEQKAESMWALYMEALRLRPRTAKKAPENKRKLQMILSALKELHGNKAVREIYLEQSAREKKEKEDINGRFEEYRDLTHKIAMVEDEVDGCARRIFGSRDTGASEIDVLLLESCRKQLDSYRLKLSEILKNSGDMAALAEYHTLRDFSQELRQENFIWSASRRQLLEQLETAAFSGQPVLLSGESGTGKTRLAEQAALKLTGLTCNITPGKDTRFQDLVAKPAISPTGETTVKTFFEYKEIGEAFSGRSNTLQNEPEHKGRIVADDEFNLLEEAEQTGRLARVASWTPGKKVRMPVTNQDVVVAPNSGYWAMVNLASERYARKKIPPEVLRKFAKVDVGYPPQSARDPELYEMMLAALLDGNGRLRASESEIIPEYEYEEREETAGKAGERTKVMVQTRKLIKNKPGSGGGTVEAGGFLWRFANAMGELNKSFAHQETILKSKGEAQFVRDLIIDIGKIFGWLKQYVKTGQGKSLEAFISAKLKEQFLDQSAYTAEDRKLVKDFLLAYGINVDAEPKAKPGFKNLSPVEVGLLSPRVEYRKIIKQEIDVNEGSYIEADSTRVVFIQKPYVFQGREIAPGAVLKGSDGKRIKYIGIRQDNGQPVFGVVKEISKPKRTETPTEPSELSESFTALQEGLAQRAADFRLTPPRLELPSLPPDFTEKHLEVFEQLFGQKLDVSAVPQVKDWDEYLNMMYPATQRPKDTQNGLTAYRPSWWEQEVDKNLVGGNEKYGTAYQRSIKAESEKMAGSVFLTESIQKPNYTDGSQRYGTKEGLEDNKDPLLPIIQEVLGSGKNRFNNNWDEVKQVAAKVKEKITAALQSRGLTVPDFDVVITPAIIANLEMVTKHPENSSTSTYEWSSTPLLKIDNSDSGYRLLVGNSDNGGGGCVASHPRGFSWYDGGFRLSVVLKKP